jgi:signal transduction histidine kinase
MSEGVEVLPVDLYPDVRTQLVRLTAERARLTEELNRSETRFRDIIERNADAIVVVDHDGVIRFANRAAAKLFGKAAEDLLERPFGFPMVAGETVELDLLRNGAPVAVEMRVVESEWEGRVACIASLRDVTERKRAEQAARRLIQEQSARSSAEHIARRSRFLAGASTVLTESLNFATTLAALPRLCVSAIADWAIVYNVEDGEVRRLDAAHADPSKVELVCQLRDYVVDAQGIQPVLEVLRSQKPLLLKQITPKWIEDVAHDHGHRELLDSLGLTSLMIVPLVARERVYGAISLASSDPDRPFDEQDLSFAEDLALRAALALDNARLYREAQDANQSKSHFLAVISHDLRTPLNSILGYSELLMMGVPDPLADGSRHQVERIGTSAAHLLYLIDELLAYARLESRAEEIRLAGIDLEQVVQQVSEVVEPLATERGLQFSAGVPEPVTFVTDPDKLRQILLNLVGNAVKYTREGGVRLEARHEHGRIVFVVQDTGVGIAQEHLQNIFEPFWQVDSSHRSRSNGTGLGLSVVKRLVLLLGGQVTVDSVPGTGTAFTVSLPRNPPATTRWRQDGRG